jgi:hypothetical protein
MKPIWAIGTVKLPPTQAQEVCAFIRGLVAKIYNEQTAADIRIQNGGSVNAKNAAGLFAQPDIDGGLVGGASLKAEDFAVICNAEPDLAACLFHPPGPRVLPHQVRIPAFCIERSPCHDNLTQTTRAH